MITSQTFYDLFSYDEGSIVKKYIWDQQSPDVGFAILKKYPSKILFIPSKNNSSGDDNLVLIKVFLIKEKAAGNVVPVGVSASNVSFYKLENPNIWREEQYDWQDQNAPTKESIEKSKQSTMPIDLVEMNRYTFNLSTNKFKDTDKNKDGIDPKAIIENIYNDHTETVKNTLRNKWFRFKISFYRNTAVLFKYLGTVISKSIKFLGYSLNNDYGIFFVEKFYFTNPNSRDDRNPAELKEEPTVHYEELLKINRPLFLGLTTFIIVLYALKEYFCINFLNIVDFFQRNKEDQIFFISFLLFILIFFNWFLPRLLLKKLNIILKIYRLLTNKKVSI